MLALNSIDFIYYLKHEISNKLDNTENRNRDIFQ
jgi:hypothetical protein